MIDSPATSSKPRNPPGTKTDFRIGNLRVYPRGKKQTYWASVWHNGKHLKQSLKTPNKIVARKRATDLWVSLSAGSRYANQTEFIASDARATRHLITDTIEEYLSAKESEKKARKTLMAYRLTLSSFKKFCEDRGHEYLDQLDPKVYQEYCRHLSTELKHPKTLENRLINLLAWGKWTHAKRTYTTRSPFHGCSVPKAPVPNRFCPSIGQVRQLLASAPQPLAALIRVLAYTGLRAGELRHLRPQDIDLEGGLIHIRARQSPHEWKPKNSRDRVVPIHRGLRSTLGEALAQAKRQKRIYVSGPLSAAGRQAADARLNDRELNGSIQAIARRVGLKTGRAEGGFVTHALRRYFETQCGLAQVPQLLIDRWIGHQSNSMSATYFNNDVMAGVELIEKVSFE